MPTLIQIFLFLVLQQGLNTGNSGVADAVNWENEQLITSKTVLMVQAEPMVLEQIISMCTRQDIGCEIRKEAIVDGPDGMERAFVTFNNLPFAKRKKLMEECKSMNGRANLQWNELYQN
jgi:hypothetical protein